MEFFYAIYHDDWVIFIDSWVLIVGPYIGAILASIIFEKFYRPLMIAWRSVQAK